MYQFFVEPSQIHLNDNTVIIVGDEVNHIKNVLRMAPGQEIAVKNGVDGKEYRCGILTLEPERVVCELRFVKEGDVELPAQIYLFQGLPKGDKMELIVQKAVELGVYQIIPVTAKRCVAKIEGKKAEAKTARWQGIARSAAQQSRRAVIPQVALPHSFSQAVKLASDMDVRLLPYELARDMAKTKELLGAVKPGQRVAVFIGPEGGFAREEAEEAAKAGVCPVTLGRRILRTETAGMTVLSWLMLQLEP